jgi:hypothetical protein
MKKFAICVAVLAVAALMVPGASAATKCYHLTNFCDGVQATQIAVGGVQKQEVVGLWDWLCIGGGTGTLMVGGPNKFGSQPVYPYLGGSAIYGFAANFTFVPSAGAFDLYGTFDGSTTLAFQTSQPFTVTKGACNPLGPRKPGAKSAVGIVR